MTLKDRLIAKSNPQENGCRLWFGAKTKNGYGHLKINGKTVDTHRAAWIAEHGFIPDGMCVCHKCDVRNCINIDHLFLGTNKENDDDKVMKGRQSRGKKHADKTRGERHGRSKLNYENVFEMRWLEAMGRSHESLAIEYGVCLATATSAIRGKTWQFEVHD